jgi:hypothetical protein
MLLTQAQRTDSREPTCTGVGQATKTYAGGVEEWANDPFVHLGWGWCWLP